jgi:hypothetical protein
MHARIMKVNYRAYLLVSMVLVSTCLAAQAQSGRRGSGKSTTTAPSVSDAKGVQAKSQKPARLQLLVGIDAAAAMSTIPYYLTDTVLDECIRRLGDSSDVAVTPAGQHMTRGDAVKAAKEEKERYVVWLQLGNDFSGTPSQDPNGPNELWVNYTILEPGTAKTKKTGRAYHSIYRAGNVSLPGPSSKQGPVYSEYAIKQAAREAADKILEAFDLQNVDRPR